MLSEIYDIIAKDFSQTRIFTWKWTDDFMKNIPKYSTILDIGCGNGRNLCYTDMIMYGMDISLEQLKARRGEKPKYFQGKNNNLIHSNMISIPFRNNIFDYILVIASFHHLNTLEERKYCLNEMNRVLKSGGKILLSVWSINQPKKTKRTFSNYGDTIVYWKNIPRYYYIFELGEIKQLLQEYFYIENHIWDCGNEIFTLIKNN